MKTLLKITRILMVIGVLLLLLGIFGFNYSLKESMQFLKYGTILVTFSLLSFLFIK